MEKRKENENIKVLNDYDKELETYMKINIKPLQERLVKNTKPVDQFPRQLQPKPDVIFLKLFPTDHPLSTEEQCLFIKITESVFGYNEQFRNETIKRLAIDYNIITIIPYVCIFIKEAIYTNIAFTDLTLLIYSVRMTKSLLSNSHINLKEHIHHILPAVLSCVLAKKICKYYYDNHWTLRDFSAYVVAMMCHMYNSSLNNITQRVINLYLLAIQDATKPLTTLYGAVKGLASLGDEIIKSHLFPNIFHLSKRIYLVLEKRPIYPEDKQLIIEAKHIRDLIVSIASPILFKTQTISDGGICYYTKFGYLGKLLYYQVKSLEQAETSTMVNNCIYLINNNGLNINVIGHSKLPQNQFK